MVKKQIGIRLSEGLIGRLQKARAERVLEEDFGGEVTVTDIIEGALEFYLSFDPWFVKKITEFSDRFKIDQISALQILATEEMSKVEGRRLAYGDEKELLPLFRFVTGGVMIGEKLFSLRLQAYRQEFEAEREKILKQQLAEAPERMRPEDLAWLKKRLSVRVDPEKPKAALDQETDEASPTWQGQDYADDLIEQDQQLKKKRKDSGKE